MKKFFAFAMLIFGAGLITVEAAPAATKPVSKTTVKTAKTSEPQVIVPVKAKEDLKRPLDQWTVFDVAFLPKLPKASWNSNVFGIKSGWPISCGIGRVFGLEASWIWSGTSEIHGIQGSWIFCMNDTLNGIEAAFLTCLNMKEFNGLQASLGYCQAGDFKGIQGSGAACIAGDIKGLQAALGVNISKNVMGFQAAGVNITKDVTGFQAAAVNVVDGKFSGVQCGLYSQVKESSGLQLGVVNVSHSKGFQFGAFNYIADAPIPFLPIFNFKF